MLIFRFEPISLGCLILTCSINRSLDMNNLEQKGHGTFAVNFFFGEVDSMANKFLAFLTLLSRVLLPIINYIYF